MEHKEAESIYRLSVIIPAFNVADTLPATLESLFSVVIDDLEVIIVDDGSLDRTAAIARSFRTRDDRIKIISQENRGLSCARNAGFSHARGEWVMFLDAGDRLLSDGLTAVREHLDDPGNVILFPFVLSNNEGRLHKTNVGIEAAAGYLDARVRASDLRSLMLGKGTSCDPESLERISFCSYNSCCSRIMRRSLLNSIFTTTDRFGNVELFFESVSSMGEDRFFELILWTALGDSLITLSSRALYHYDVGNETIATHLTLSILDHLPLRRKVIFERMCGDWLSLDEADLLMSKDLWEYFLTTTLLYEREEIALRARWKRLAYEEGFAEYFKTLPEHTLQMRIYSMVIGGLIQHKRLEAALNIDKMLREYGLR